MTERDFWQAAWVAAKSANWAVSADGAAFAADDAVRALRSRVSHSCTSCGRVVVDNTLTECAVRVGVLCHVAESAELRLPDAPTETMSNTATTLTPEEASAALAGVPFCAHCGGCHPKGAPHV